MTLQYIRDHSRETTDENYNDEQIELFARHAISRINTECNTKFPTFGTMGEDYTYIPDDWLLDLVSPFLSYEIKMNDTVLTEAQLYLDWFNERLRKFKEDLAHLVEIYDGEGNGINPDYVDTELLSGIYPINTNMALGQYGYWFGYHGNGGTF